MIKILRKRHRQVWTAWAVLLPAGIVLGWLAVPNLSPVQLLNQEKQVLLPVLYRTVDKKDYTINLRTDKDKYNWQLEWKRKSVLTVPSAVIYRVINSGTDVTKQQLIGRIESGSDYVFALPDDPTGYIQLQLTLYDFIHEKKIDSINF